MPSPYYGMRDPFAEINARLRKLGLQPITMGGAPAKPDIAAMHQRPLSTPSPMEAQQALKQQAKIASGPMYNQLTPEAEEGVMEKIGGGLLSGLEWFGKALDSATGARAIRGILGGNFREALSFAGPLAPWTDTFGITDQKDIVGGRELLEKGGILGKNEEGLDWGDAAGFGAEVLLDPSTYFFGAGLFTKGAQVATKTGKALNKIGVLEDLLKQGTKDPKLLTKFLAGKTDEISVDMLKSLEAAGGAMPKKMMGQRQLGRHLNLEDVLRVDDELTDILKSSGKELPEDVAAMKSSFRGISGRSVRDTLTESLEGGADELAELLAETTGKAGGELLPLTSHWSMGFPTLFTGEKGTKGIRQALFRNLPEVLQRKQYFPGLDTKFGAMLSRNAGRIDTAGKIMRFGKLSPIRPLATIFNPNLKWSARTAEAQEGILASVSKFDRHVAEQQTALNSIASKWRRHGLFDMQKYTMSLEEGGFGLGEKEAKELIGKHIDELMSWQEGYNLRFADDGMPLSQLPQYDIKSAAKIGGIADINAVKAGNYLNTIENQIGYILKKVSPEEGAARLRQLKQAKSQAEEMLKVYTREGETLRAIKNPDDIGHAIDRLKSYEKQFDNVEEYIDVIDRVDFTNTKAFKVTRPKFSSPQGGVHHRLRPEFSQTFREQLKSLGLGELDDAGNLMGIEQDLVRLKSMADEAMDFAKQSGIDIGQLTDEYALYRPRSVTDPRPRGVMGAIEKARAKKHLKNRMREWSKDAGPEAENLNPLTYRSKQRREYLMGVFGGTTTLNYFYNKYGGIDFTRFRGNRTIGTDIEEKVLEAMASDNYWGHAIQDKNHLDSLLDRGILKEVEVTDTGEILNAHNISKEFDAHGKSVYLDRDNELVGKLATSILLKDSETAKQGAKLFSVDPIRSMLGYYGDVMKAANAAEILVDIASENAYFSIAGDVAKFAKAADGEAHTISDIFSKTKLNTVIGKRNFLQRFKAERPDEWRFFKEYWTADVNNLPDNLAAQKRNMINLRKENPEFYKFMLTGPGKLRVGDRVATKTSRYAALRGKKVVAITSIDDQGRQVINNAGPEVPTNTPKPPIDHSPPESTFGSEPMPDGPYQSITSDSVPPTLKQPGVDVVDEAAEVLEETATPKLDLSDENIEAMEDVIAGLREGRYKYEDIPSVDAEFYAAGVMKQFGDLETRRHGRLFDKGGKLKSDWNERYANILGQRIADKMKKLQAKEPVEIPTLGSQPSAQQQVDEIIGSTVPKAPEVSVPDVTPAPTGQTYDEIKKAVIDYSDNPELTHLVEKQGEIDELMMSYEGDDLLAEARLEAGGAEPKLPKVDAKLAKLEKELEDGIQKLVKQGDEAVTPATEPTLWDQAAPGSGPTLNAGEKIILEDSLVWNKRNPKNGRYTTKDGGFEIRPVYIITGFEAGTKPKGWALHYLGDDGKIFRAVNDYGGPNTHRFDRLLKDAKAGAKELQESLKAKADAPAKPPAKLPEQIAPALTGDQPSLFKPTGEAAAGTGDEGYKQLQAARTPEALALKTAEEHIEQVARTPGFGRLDIKPLPLREKPTPRLGHTPKDAATPKKPVDIVPTEPPATGPTGPTVKPPGTAGTYVFVEGHHEWVPIEELIHMDDIPNHILVNEKHTENLLSNFIIEPELSDDLKRYLNSFTKRDITNEMVAVLDYFTDSFKELATSIWPAFHFRNFISGQVNNMYSGAYDPERHGIMKWVQPVKDAMLLAQGKSIKGLSELPIFKGMSDAQISQAIIDAANGHGLVGSGQHMSDLAHHADEVVSNNFMEQVGGPAPAIGKEDRGYLSGVKSRTKQAGDLGGEVVGEVLGKTIPGYTDTRGIRGFTKFKRWGFQLGNEVEWLNRISPLIAHLKKGLSMEEAIVKVKLAQVDYKALTPFEKEWFKKIIPFYTFTRRQIPFVMEQISDPSSGMSQMAKTMFRTKKAMEDPNDPIPDWISHGVNLPLHKLGLGGSEPGMARYLTGLGGFIGGAEDVMSLISPGHGPMDTIARSSARMGARANPAAQVPIEMMTGVSLFHQRPYKDMKSPTARLLGQVSGSEFVPKWPNPQLDMLLQRIPGFGRTVSTARTITDSTRRPIFDEEGGFSVANLLARTVPTVTGAKVHDTDMDRIKNRLLQNRLEEILSHNPNMVKFSQIYIPEDKLMALSQEEREAYMLYKKLGSAAAKASYARRKAAEYSN